MAIKQINNTNFTTVINNIIGVQKQKLVPHSIIL